MRSLRKAFSAIGPGVIGPTCLASGRFRESMTDQDEGSEKEGGDELDINELELEGMEELEEMDLVGEVKAGGGETAEGPPAAAAPPEGPANILSYAPKVYAMELVSGEFFRGAGSSKSYLRMWNGEDVEKARLMGTIVQKFVSNDQNYCAITIDDGTETIRIKGWREDAAAMLPFDVGRIVDVMSYVREYNGEVYLSPISIAEITDPNWEPLRELEIYKLRKVKKNDLRL